MQFSPADNSKDGGHSVPTLRFQVLTFRFFSPVRRLDQPQGSGGLGEHCSSPAVGRGRCAPLGRVRSPACLRLIEGAAQRRQTGVAFSLVTFFLAKQKKVTSCRATPGEVDCGLSHSWFDKLTTNGVIDVGYRYAQPNLHQLPQLIQPLQRFLGTQLIRLQIAQ